LGTPERVKKHYRAPRTQEERDRLVEEYAPLVNYVVGRILASLPPQIERDDLLSWGVLGLLAAADSYDSGRGAKFETYAVAKIRGAILEYLRREDWVPRSVRSKARRIEQTQQELERLLGRPARAEEIASHMGISLVEYDRLLSQVSGLALMSLDAFLADQEPEHMVSAAGKAVPMERSPLEGVEREERRRLLRAAVLDLPEREVLVISLYYYEGMTLREIGQILGVTEARVCQLHTQALLRLRGRLSGLGIGAR
jgi:RNA polymerase sigma factor for flagellar operon FliA